MNESSQRALEYFSQGYVCSEAVFKAILESKGVDATPFLAMSSGFGSGMARTDQGLCGAFSGGILALSYFLGRKEKSDALEPLYSTIQTFKKRFESHCGSCECSTLLGFSLASLDAGERFEKETCKACKCDRFVAYATKEVVAILGK